MSWLGGILVEFAGPPMARVVADATLKGVVVLLAAGGLAWALRRRSASARHHVWAMAFLGLLLVPVLAQVLPAWNLPLLPDSYRLLLPAEIVFANPGLGDVGADQHPDRPVGPTGAPEAVRPIGTRQSDRTLPQTKQAPGESAQSRLELPGSAVIAGARGAETAPTPSEGWRAIPASGLIVVVWLAGVGLLIVRLAIGTVSAWWITWRATTVVDPAWLRAVAEAKHRVGHTRSLRLARSPAVTTPMAWGMLRPTVLLPEASDSWTPERRRVVLLHELAHIKRRDCLLQLLAQLATALHWFNPMAWLAARRLRAEREVACDDMVLSVGTRGTDYARHLLEIARTMSSSNRPVWAAVSMARPSQLEGRLLAILDNKRDRGGPSRIVSLAVVALVMLLAVPLAALEPWAVAAEPSSDSGVAAEAHEGAHAATHTGQRPQSNRRESSPTLSGFDTEAVVRDLFARDRMTQELTEGFLTGAGPVAEGAASALEGAATAAATSAAERMWSDALLSKWLGTAVQQGEQEPTPPANSQERQALRDRVLDAMIAALADEDPSMRRQAVHALGEAESSRAVAALGRALQEDSDAGVRRQAAWALGMIEDSSALEALAAAVDDAEAGVREQVAWALGMIEDRAGVAPLATLMADADQEVRQQAAWALGMIEDPAAIDALALAVSDSDPNVREQVAWALGMIEDAGAVSTLGAMLSDSSADVREQAVWALGMIEDAAAIDPLVGALQDEDDNVREQAAWALGMIEDARAVDPLASTLAGDVAWRVRRQAAWALGMIEDERAADALLDALEDESEEVRKQALWALSMVIGGDADDSEPADADAFEPAE